MSRRDDDHDEDRFHGDRNRSSGRGNRSDARGADSPADWEKFLKDQGKTSGFDSSKLSNDKQNFFGFELTPELSLAVNGLWAYAVGPARKYMEKNSEKIATDFAKTHLAEHFPTDMAAKAFGSKVGNYVGWATIFSKQISDAIDIGATGLSNLSAVSTAIQPVAKANGQGNSIEALFGMTDNHMINNAVGKTAKVAGHDFIKMLAGMVFTLPEIFNKVKEQQTKVTNREQQLKFENLDNMSKEEKAALFKKEMGNEWATIEAKNKHLQDILDTSRQERADAYKAFKRENQKAITETFETELAEIGKNTRLERLGLNENSKKLLVGDKRKENNNQKVFEKALESRIKQEFVIRNGAFDRTEAALIPHDYLGKGDTTHETRITKEYNDRWAKLTGGDTKTADGKKVDPKDDKMHPEFAKGMAAAAAAVAYGVLNSMFGTSKQAGLNNHIALDDVLELRRQMEENENRESIRSRNDRNTAYSFVQYVDRIIKKDLDDCHHRGIADSETQHFKTAGFKDEAVQKMDDKDLSAYEMAVKHIARRIQDGRMDALALVNLLGDDGNIVAKTVQSFSGKEDPDIKEKIIKEIDHQSALMRPHHAIDHEKLSELMAHFNFDFKKAFGPNGYKGAERAFLFSIVESHITDEKALHDVTNLTSKEMADLRKEWEGHAEKTMTRAIQAVAEVLEKTPEKLEDMHLTDNEKSAILRLAEELERGGKQADDLLSANKDRKLDIEAKIANAVDALSAQDSTFWRDKVESDPVKSIAKRARAGDSEELMEARGEHSFSKRYREDEALDEDRRAERMQKHKHRESLDLSQDDRDFMPKPKNRIKPFMDEEMDGMEGYHASRHKRDSRLAHARTRPDPYDGASFGRG